MSRSAQLNPFRTERLEQLRYRFTHGSWTQLIQRFHQLGQRGFIVGKKGSGKTTLLLEWQQRLENEGALIRAARLSSSTTRQERREMCRELVLASRAGAILLIDGAEQLSWLQQLRLLKRKRHPHSTGWIATRHALHNRHLLLHQCITSPELLAQLTRDLLHDSQPPERDILLSRLQWEPFHQQHRGNLRDAFLALYDTAARTPVSAGNPRA